MENVCTNCEHSVSGNFCANCGQSVKSRRGPIWRMLGELAEEFFTLDSKFFTSIYSLFLKPGFLTKEFIDGRRVSVLPPIRMYLVISVLFFLIFQFDAPDVSEKNVYIGDILVGKEQPNPDFGKVTITDDKYSITWLSKILDDKREEIQTTNPQIIVNKIFNVLEGTLPNALIVCLPLFAFFLKLLYAFKRYLYFDHMLFVLHFQTWLMCWVMITYGMALIDPLWSILTVAIPIYLAIAQARFYKQTYWLVIPKTLVILAIYIGTLFTLALVSLLFSLVVL